MESRVKMMTPSEVLIDLLEDNRRRLFRLVSAIGELFAIRASWERQQR